MDNEEICVWTEANEFDWIIWYSKCGEVFTFEEGGPKHNTFTFCPYCGKKLIEKELRDG